MRKLSSLILCVLVCVWACADTHTAVADGAWVADAATVWNTGTAPADGDAISIPVTYDVVLDADLTVWGTGLAASVINGTLAVSTSAGTYGLKLAGTLSGTGQLLLRGGVGIDLADNVICNINSTYNGNLCTMSGAHEILCTEPSVIVATLKNGEALGATKLYLNETLDSVWSNNRLVEICNINKAQQIEERIISGSGVDGGGQYLTISVGLTASKLEDSYVALKSRNIQFTGNSGASQICFNTISGATIKAGFDRFARAFSSMSSLTITGGVFSLCAYGWRYTNSSTLTNVVFTGCTTAAMDSCRNNTATDCFILGNVNGLQYCPYTLYDGCNVSGNGNGFYLSYNNSCIDNVCLGNAYAVVSCYGSSFVDTSFTSNSSAFVRTTCNKISGGDFTNNTLDLDAGNGGYFSGTSFSGGTRYGGYLNYSNYSPFGCTINDGGVSGAYSSATSGGIVTNSTTAYPTGYTWSYRHAVETADAPCFWQEELRLAAYERAVYRVWLRKTASFATLPKAEIVDKFADPLVDSTETALATVTMSDSTDTWEMLLLEYKNNSATPKDVIVRVSAQNASGDCYSRCDRVIDWFGHRYAVGGN